MADELKRITGLPEGVKPLSEPTLKKPAKHPSFSEVIGEVIKDVDHLHKTAEKTTEKLITGELKDVHEVVVAMEEAQTSFKLLMEVRNKMLDAYREIMKMQV